jgi:hypothetical protein
MPEVIQQYSLQVHDNNGVRYTVFALGEARPGGTWEGWLEFHPDNNSMPTLRTDRETTQPDRVALAYWASGLEPLYFEGAFSRATRNE